MELRDYLKIIGKRIWLLVASVVIVTLGAYLFTYYTPISYDGSIYINATVKNEDSTQESFYQYDNYYSIQASSLFADTIANWLQDPSNVMGIYKKVGVDLSNAKLKNITKMITTKKRQPATVVVNINDQSQAKTQMILNEIINFVEQKTGLWSQEGLVQNAYADISSPVVIVHKSDLPTNCLSGLVAGLILGLGLVFLVEYLAKDRK